MTQKALITGITGQDGSYLAELLLDKGYEVHGLIRRSSTLNTSRIDHIYNEPHEPGTMLFLHHADLTSTDTITSLIYDLQPAEVYHLGGQSHVGVSFEEAEYTGDVTGLGTTRVLEAIRRSGVSTRIYQASSSEMFGNAPPPQNEATPFQPRSPYACAKAYSFWMASGYREAYGMFSCNGILFNHESPRRGETFVTKYGGSFMDSDDPATRSGVARDIVFLEAVGINPVVVHGGGKAITKALAESGVETHFVQGHRVTTPESVKVVEQVLSHKVNPGIVGMINELGGKALTILNVDSQIPNPLLGEIISQNHINWAKKVSL